MLKIRHHQYLATSYTSFQKARWRQTRLTYYVEGEGVETDVRSCALRSPDFFSFLLFLQAQVGNLVAYSRLLFNHESF